MLTRIKIKILFTLFILMVTACNTRQENSGLTSTVTPHPSEKPISTTSTLENTATPSPSPTHTPTLTPRVIAPPLTTELLQNFDYETSFALVASWDDVVKLHQEIQANPLLNVDSIPMDIYDSWQNDGETLVLIKGQLGINLMPRYAVKIQTPSGNLHMVIIETISSNDAGEVVHGSINVLIEDGLKNYPVDSTLLGNDVRKFGNENGYYISIRFILESSKKIYYTDLIMNEGMNLPDQKAQGRVDFINSLITPEAAATSFYSAAIIVLGK